MENRFTWKELIMCILLFLTFICIVLVQDNSINENVEDFNLTKLKQHGYQLPSVEWVFSSLESFK